MKAKLLLGLSIVCFLTNALSCKDDDPMWRLTSIDVKNMNNEGEQPFASDDSIRKEAYAIDILYVGRNLDNMTDYSRIDFKNCKDTIIEQKILCNTNLDENYLAGSDVTKLFKPLYGRFAENSSELKWYGGTFILHHTPQPGIHSFRVCVYLGNGTIIEQNTRPVKLY
ncbi:hypothetical protein [Viscerimonas tarda]